MDVHLGKAESEERRVYSLLLIKIILSACCRCVEEEEKLCLGLVHHPGNVQVGKAKNIISSDSNIFLVFLMFWCRMCAEEEGQL